MAGKGHDMRAAFVSVAIATMVQAGAAAADVRVRVLGVRSGEGQVLVALCGRDEFLSRSCDHVGSAPAAAGATEVVIADVPPGIYAAQAVHDENGNRDLDRGAFGLPREGLGFSRDATMLAGPPRFADAAVEVGTGGGVVSFALRYF